tara:strand:+ start:1197 stop:1775 length:579 start_codon:yes stop_codon:yes gene_type:complete
MLKGWSVTISAALFALAGTIKEPSLAFIAVGPIIIFWILDSIFLANERCYVSLYSCVVKGNKLLVKNKDLLKKERVQSKKENGKEFMNPEQEKEIKTTLLSMNFKPFRIIKRNNWFSVMFSYTIIWFYSLLFISTFLVFFGMSCIDTSTPQEKINVTSFPKDTLDIKVLKEREIINNIYINDTLRSTESLTK